MISIHRVKGAVGAEITGVDWTSTTREVQQRIYAAFLKHHVLVFRNQTLSEAQLLQVAKTFGQVSKYPFAQGMKGYPEITEIIKEPEQTSNFGGMWHSDTTYLQQPPKCTLLYAVQTPPRGLGDTMFSDMTKVYDSLSNDIKSKLEGLTAIQSSDKNAAVLRGDHLASGSMQNTGIDSTSHETSHPMIRTHPETGEKALFVNPSHTLRLENMTVQASQPLLEHLFEKSTLPEFTSRISWEPGTLLIWDNRCLIHCAINDYNGHRRVMRRITIAGDKPY